MCLLINSSVFNFSIFVKINKNLMEEKKNVKTEEKSEFDKLLEKLEEQPVPERQCSLDDIECISCGS